uniref:Large ribosomal subunit protein bL32c n=1 Tax=Euglena longa TaxID=3037 RepID=RK32_EUGLO|nr:ribosomal protein L32 [Euglena longa]P27751.3 RecName: Full=Large ribosomal subunit protein bL32c; AltName: Full=50S ribosomal protein L32, plastid [Euglena longa]CAC24575.1 ribosomal protein L32 [Euglena longa]
MAVPKKKMSHSKSNSRKSNWKRKVIKKINFAVTLGKSLSFGKLSKFYLDD